MIKKKSSLNSRIYQYRYLYLLTIPGLIYILIFKFVPMWGLLLAFKEYNFYTGILGSKWVGLKHFTDLFADPFFLIMLRNTIVINMLSLILFFPLPIIISLMLNEVRRAPFKRIMQSIIYLPHFLSWVVIVSLTFFMLSSNVGLVNKLLVTMNFQPVSFLTEKKFFWLLIVFQNIWKETGWGTILFLAAIAGIDVQLYEAAVMDGASRMKQIWHITLPSIRPTIVILLILRLGAIFDVGFEQVLLMANPLVRDVAEVFDTYAFTQGIQNGQMSLGIAVGFFKSLVGLTFVLSANYLAKKIGDEGIY
ncbi:MAG TPA: ABC transporter permease subunit [Clostridiaceae bacterium]